MKESIMIRAGQDALFRPGIKKDSVYWEKRQKNNEAARRSRERRRNRVLALENHLQELKKENEDMRAELAIIKRRFGLPPSTRVIGYFPLEQLEDKTTCFKSSNNSRVPVKNHSERDMIPCPDTFPVSRSANQDKIYLDPRQGYHQSHEASVPLCLKREVRCDTGQNSVPTSLSYPQTYIRKSIPPNVDNSFQVKTENVNL